LGRRIASFVAGRVGSIFVGLAVLSVVGEPVLGVGVARRLISEAAVRQTAQRAQRAERRAQRIQGCSTPTAAHGLR
jgi:hypothetical protein